MFATGSCASYTSFIDIYKRVWTRDVKYNIENAFYAALHMADKQVWFNQIPMTRLTIGDKEVYFIGEHKVGYDESYKIDGGNGKCVYLLGR